MSFINIITNNLSRGLVNSTTFEDNWVYVPGTAITGDYTRPVPITSLEEFKNKFGTHGPDGSITFEYVAGLLSSGLPILFRRIACVGQDTPSETLGCTKAQAEFTHYDSVTGDQIIDVMITEKFGGTYGNDIIVKVRNTGVAYWLDVYLKHTLLEKVKLVTIRTSETQLELNQRLMDALNTVELDRIDINVVETDPEKFELSTNTAISLTGGTDFDEDLVAAEIPASYNYITDKILYSPKFITSGGYTDTDPSSDTAIGTAMKNLTYVRQDCRAIIDLPIGTPSDEQQDLAGKYSYQQLSATEIIPSAMVLAPWQYMQVGTEQLWMPPSYVYLTVVGNALSKGGEAYTPKAGITSGKVSNIIKSQFDIGSALSEAWQADGAVQINPIMKLQSGDYVIAGNSTLLKMDTDELNAFSESSADLTVIEIRRFVYKLATELQYQYNAIDAFETFSIRTAKYLEAMITEGAVTSYDIENISTNDDPRTLKINLSVYLTPTIKAIEIYLNVAYGSVELSTGGEV